MGINEIVRSKGYKNFMAKLYGFGAAIVIIGALFKILHLPGASLMLTLGMGTEAVIFIFSAFEPLHAEYDWSLVYPELAGLDGHGGHGHAPSQALLTPQKSPLSEKLDEMLEAANIDNALLESLSTGLRSLDATTKNLNAVSEVASVNAVYAEQLSKLTENLNALNNTYEQQLKVSLAQIEASAQAQAEMTKVLENISGSISSSEKYKSEIASLSENVTALNKIYSNMLSAMGKA